MRFGGEEGRWSRRHECVEGGGGEGVGEGIEREWERDGGETRELEK